MSRCSYCSAGVSPPVPKRLCKSRESFKYSSTWPPGFSSTPHQYLQRCKDVSIRLVLSSCRWNHGTAFISPEAAVAPCRLPQQQDQGWRCSRKEAGQTTSLSARTSLSERARDSPGACPANVSFLQDEGPNPTMNLTTSLAELTLRSKPTSTACPPASRTRLSPGCAPAALVRKEFFLLFPRYHSPASFLASTAALTTLDLYCFHVDFPGP